MQLALLYLAVAFFLVKIASTVWVVCQPDATTVTASKHGRAIYYASKLSAILFVAAMLARTCARRAPAAYIAFWAVLLVVAMIMAVVVIRQRAMGAWYGYGHVVKQGWRRRHDR